MNKKTVVVIFGGKSPEHEVSVITAIQVLSNLDKEKYHIVPIYVSKEGAWYTGDNLLDPEIYKDLSNIPNFCNFVWLSPNEGGKWSLKIKKKGLFNKDQDLGIDIIFPCFHGGLGEGGGFQGVFDLAEIPFVGSGILGSSLGMDKETAKNIFLSQRINQAKFIAINRKGWESDKKSIISNIVTQIKFPLFVKPSALGSSIGVTRVISKDKLEDAIDVALCFGFKALVEEAIDNAREINVSVMGTECQNPAVSVCEEVFGKKSFLSFEDKYKSSSKGAKGMVATNRQIPAKLLDSEERKVKEIAIKAFKALSCSGLVRVDFLLKKSEIFLLEVNTIPGSYSFYLWEASGVKFPALCDNLIRIAEEEFKRKSQITTSFSGNLLSNIGSSLKSPK
jgi:D-alanine-D-alanine ligase